MRVGVGSGNPVKRDAVAAAVGDAAGDFGARASVEPCPVPSGVSDQPRGHAETIRGAETRAAKVLEEGSYDLGVGLEGGVAEFPGADGLYLVMWAAVDDGTAIGHGAGPSIALPAEIERRVRNGEELGPAVDDVLGERDVGRKAGAIGAFTDDRVDRTAALATAVAGALAPFECDAYDA